MHRRSRRRVLSSPLRSNRWAPRLKLMTDSPDPPGKAENGKSPQESDSRSPTPMKLLSVNDVGHHWWLVKAHRGIELRERLHDAQNIRDWRN